MHMRLLCTRALWVTAARINAIWPMPIAFSYHFLVAQVFIQK